MAELATGAVSTLLGVISHEAARLGRVRVDMQFIQEEMESMSSFLANLSRTSREHDEQIRTWMNQVRILANDCNSCIDLYLYRGDPEFHRPRAGLGRYLWWAPWLLRKVLAQHRAAGQLRELKDRARDIGDRRLRYGVEVKTDQSSSTEPLLATTQDREEDDEEEEEDEQDEDNHDQDHGKVAGLVTTIMNMDTKDYLNWRLDRWIGPKVRSEELSGKSIAFLVPDNEKASALASQALDLVKAHLKQGAEENTTHEDEGAVQKQSQNKWDVVLVDVPKVHIDFFLLQPHDILYYIQHKLQQSQQQQGTASTSDDAKWSIFYSKMDIIWNIRNEVYVKIEETKTNICQVVTKEKKKLEKEDKDAEQKPPLDEALTLGKLLWLLVKSTITDPATVAEQDQKKKSDMRGLVAWYDSNIRNTAEMLKKEVEVVTNPGGGSKLEVHEYEGILREVFPRPTTATAAAATSTNSTNTTLVEDQIKEIIQGVKEMLHDLRELDNYSHKGNNQETAGEPAQTWEADFKEATEKKMEEIRTKVTYQLIIKGMIENIKKCLGDDKKRILVILKTDDDKHLPVWEETRKTLSKLGCAAITGAMIVATKTTEYKNYEEGLVELELVEYPLVARFLDTMLESTRQHMHEDNRRIIRDILYECDSHEFCMKIFVHALYDKPKRSTDELHKLLTILQATQKSLPNIARKMLKFSYKDLPKQYRSCLLYLAIFPKNFPMRRSTLIGRWVAEGLITTKEWRWSSSVDEAEKCFDTLIARYLVCPAGTGGTGRVKSFTVHKQVFKFITKIAMKQRILETRLSDHLARHFSIFSDIRLRRSEKVKDFLQNIPNSSQFSKLKVLDLEGCDCFPEYQGCLRDVCSKILMLKYLSLRKTNVTHLPGEINNLHELEVLDIRQTKIPAYETRNVLLRKLKRLLAGQHIDSSTSSSAAQFSSVQIPEKIEKMEGVEVLSNVEPQSRYDLNNIAKLGMLKKLGVVINKDSHLHQLLAGAVDDLLYRGLRSVSITLNIEETGRHDDRCTLPTVPVWKSTNVLESLSITGTTRKWNLLTAFANVAKQLAKVTLSDASLSEDDMKVLAMLPNLRCVGLRHIRYTQTQGSKLIFTEGGFENLNNFLIEGSNITEIRFENGAGSKLEKIIWSFTKIDSLSGIDKLPRLKELELKGETVPAEVEQGIRQKSGLHYKHIVIDNQDQAMEHHVRETESTARCPSLWKAKGWRRRN